MKFVNAFIIILTATILTSTDKNAFAQSRNRDCEITPAIAAELELAAVAVGMQVSCADLEEALLEDAIKDGDFMWTNFLNGGLQ